MDDTGPLDFNDRLFKIRRLSDGRFYGKGEWGETGTHLTKRGLAAVLRGSFTKAQLQDLEVIQYRLEELGRHDAYRIKRNAVQCLKCNEIIVSTHRHDFKWCKCKGIAVDGGTSYLKRCGNLNGYKELSEMGPYQP